ncbi:MAG TPA: dienelactone hydrolase family protein [Acidimicrobiales bacterium]|nr:dienelactone hydrolase family protein [Acidimicrobiales bacterium]
MRITLPSGTPAEIARPDGTPTRGLVLIPDIGGLRPLFDDHVARLAAENGWTVCAFELWPGRDDLPTIGDRLQAGSSLDDARVLGDAVAAADATGVEPVGIVGFCMGGMYALKAAGTGRFARAVSFYGMGRVPEMWQSPTQGEPLDALAAPEACPALLLAGTADPWVPEEDMAALEAAGVEVVRYEGADHGFAHDASRDTHRADDAADAWRRAVTHLSAP